jgi:hypothetical protein
MVMRIFKGVEFPYRATTVNTTVTDDDYQIDITANDVTITLISAVGIPGRRYSLKNSGTGTGTIATTSSQGIDGITDSTQTIDQCDNMVVMSNNIGWIII